METNIYGFAVIFIGILMIILSPRFFKIDNQARVDITNAFKHLKPIGIFLYYFGFVLMIFAGYILKYM